METLLISPATRGEVVAGKFLAVTALGVASAVWNVALLLAAVAVGQILLPDLVLVSLPGLALSVLMVVPVTMVLAAGALALGVQARSTKEGNFYMVPMFIVVVPLIYYSAAPGIELDGKTSWVPITNAMIVQQRLMAVRPDPFPWQHLPAVAVSMTACVVGALWFAARQFNREDVLFRESGPAGGGGLLRSLFGRR